MGNHEKLENEDMLDGAEGRAAMCIVDARHNLIRGPAGDIPLYSSRGFEILSDLWVKVGWQQRYLYTFAWQGLPIIQLPEDLVRAQELIWRIKPRVIIETGVAYGGSLAFWRSLLLQQMAGTGGAGRIVIGIERGRMPGVAERLSERAPLLMLGGGSEEVRFARFMTQPDPGPPPIGLIDGDSVAPHVVSLVADVLSRAEYRDAPVMVFLDSCHDKAHVMAELDAYAPFVTPGSYIVACDSVRGAVHNVPRGKPEWLNDHPGAAAREWAAHHPEFSLEIQPPRVWNASEGGCMVNVSHWTGGWLRRCA